MAAKRILLIEPGYKNKYPPLGLMKLASYHGAYGKRDYVRFVKGEDTDVLAYHWDRVYVTSLFSFEFDRIARSIDFALTVVNGQSHKVFVGGIAASLMPERFQAESRWSGVRFIRGLLTQAPAQALQLDSFSGELYSDDIDGPSIEDEIPDYSILDQIDYKYPVRDGYFVYASRGCIRTCGFCGVPKLEGPQRDTKSLSGIVREIERRHGPKKDLILMDNNVVASPRFSEIIDEIVDLGFGAGARLERNGRSYARRVDFNQGVDARILSKDPQFLKELARSAIKPLRIAFDHLGLRKPYETSIRYAHDAGLFDLSNYMLYNFHDSPADLYARMHLNVELNEELSIRIFSFPMRYQPTNLPDRSHVGEKWSRYELRSMQLILQATHGVVSGEPEFFRIAFGSSVAEFEELLLRPHRFIFNRQWYERGPGKPELDEYRTAIESLPTDSRRLLASKLSSVEPRFIGSLSAAADSASMRTILSFYRPFQRGEEQKIWAYQRLHPRIMTDRPAEDEMVEDADLAGDEAPPKRESVA